MCYVNVHYYEFAIKNVGGMKIILKWITDPNLEAKPIKILEENRRKS